MLIRMLEVPPKGKRRSNHTTLRFPDERNATGIAGRTHSALEYTEQGSVRWPVDHIVKITRVRSIELLRHLAGMVGRVPEPTRPTSGVERVAAMHATRGSRCHHLHITAVDFPKQPFPYRRLRPRRGVTVQEQEVRATCHGSRYQSRNRSMRRWKCRNGSVRNRPCPSVG